MQESATIESGLKRGAAGRMSFSDLQIGSAMQRLAAPRQGFALDGLECNEKSPILFTGSRGALLAGEFRLGQACVRVSADLERWRLRPRSRRSFGR